MKIIISLVAAASLLTGSVPANANNVGTVDAHEYEQVSWHDGMPRSKAHRIFDTNGKVVTKRLPSGQFAPATTVIGARVYVGPWQERVYKNACDDSPVIIDYTFHLGKWVVTGWDAYYPQTYPDRSHSCLSPHPND